VLMKNIFSISIFNVGVVCYHTMDPTHL